VEPNDVDGIERALRMLHARFKSGSLKAMPERSAAIAAYDARNTASSLTQVFDLIQDRAATGNPSRKLIL